jgi:hypothetical protein
MKEYSYTSTHPLGHTGTVMGLLYLYLLQCRLLHDMTEDECLTYLEDVQTTVNVTHIRRKEESWNFKTSFTRESVVLRDVKAHRLMVVTDVLYKAALSIFRAEGASTFLETKYSIYLDTEAHGVVTSHKIITFYVHHSVHREAIPKKFQQDDTLVQYFINSCKSLYMFRVKQSPIIRSSIKLYLQHLVFINRVWLAVVVDESELIK